MKRRIRVEPEAEAELQAAAEWYESQHQGLALDLLKEAAAAYSRIASGDHGVPVPQTRTHVRRIAIQKFPLWVVFIEHQGEVVVVAYAHERRRPDFWVRRIRSR